MEGKGDETMLEVDDGYDFVDENGHVMTKMHVWHFFSTSLNSILRPYMQENCIVLKTSIRMPLIILGQDEAIFKQYLICLMHLAGPDGKHMLVPKDEGLGLMIVYSNFT